MIYIRHAKTKVVNGKTKKRFIVVNTATNGEPLRSSETFNSKQSAYKSIMADWLQNYPTRGVIYWIDETLKMPVQYKVFPDGNLMALRRFSTYPIKTKSNVTTKEKNSASSKRK